ncbi:phosphatase PAP2 family protein [Sphingomonas sp.]|uniref:phosphatase PAP2 family protein n=1 Tax=Sphingomonas sp. TaxID=28214 RepID=UPI0025FE4DB0|nr:phosphatase PAP2 family protein [Sphingomonas sp.]
MSNDSISWAAITALAVAVIGAELTSPLHVAMVSLANLAFACAALGSAALFYRHVRVNDRFSACCIGLAQALVFSALGAVLSYLLARDGGPLWDPTLHRWDRALGLDWLAYARFVDRHAWLVAAYGFAYGTLIPQTIVVIVALGFSGRLDRLRMFILAAILSGTTAILLSPLFPAVGNFTFLALKPSGFAHVWQSADLADVRDFLAVRNGSLASLDLRKMQGIIVFPSYHGALAATTLWAFWTSGLKWLRWGGGLVALLTIAATPVNGGHYFVDVIAGVAIAGASIAAARRLVFARLPLEAITALPFRRSRAAFAR